jgi:heat shock protein HslJ
MTTKTIYSMKPTAISPPLMLICLLFAFASCQKETVNVDLTANKWKLISLTEQQEVRYPDHDYLLEFRNVANLTVSLDVNGCFGNYHAPGNGDIQFLSGLACTEVCCDSEIAQQFIRLLPSMTRYSGKGDTLTFTGEDGDRIVLTRE